MFYLFRRQDWVLNAAIAFLICAGLLVSLSVSGGLFTQQLASAVLGVLLIFIFAHIDWRALSAYRWVLFGIYFISLGLLLFAFFFAPVIRGTRSWLVLGPVQFQVSEFAKLALIIFFAYYFSRRHVGIAHLGNIIVSLVYLLLPGAFVFFQPDMGSLLVLVGIWIGFLLVSGIRWKHIFIGLGITLVGLIFAWTSVLQPYQKERIVGLFQPNYDPLGVNYNTIQSKIAIGSGGLIGKGFGRGTQVQLGFLPEAASDFVFAAFIEEWGLLGGLFILAAFLTLIFRIIMIGMESENNFSRFVCLGTAIMFLIQFVINVGSAIGLTPVIGLTFPFMSYGGSSLLINSILIGIVQSTRVHRMLA